MYNSMENSGLQKKFIAERIRLIRKRAKESQIEFASRLNVTQATISALENDGKISMDLLYKISSIYKISVSWLLEGVGNEMPNSEIDQALIDKHYSEKQDPGANQVNWKERTMAEMQKRIESLEADKVYLAECLKLALNQNANFPEGNELSLTPENEGCKQIVFMPNYSAVVTQRVA